MANARYSAAEVVFLLSLTREQAVDLDAAQPDSLSRLSANPEHRAGGSEGAGLMLVARWHDVHEARSRIASRRHDEELAQMRAAGYTEVEIAIALGTSQPTVSRRFKATLEDLLEELGGEADPGEERTSQPSLCLACGVNPRARLRARTRRVRGQSPRTVRPERQVGVCVDCATDEVREELVQPKASAA